MSLAQSNSGLKKLSSSGSQNLCRQFSLSELQLATDNFNQDFFIGRGGFGKVYKGTIDNGTTTVAIKRLHLESGQGGNEFWTEIKMLSELRHEHLVCLIGYCNQGQEMILVYEYMARGTLEDHLYRNIAGTGDSPLPWELRLQICIGAASGLHRLHTNRPEVIHRDVKSPNILLDANWLAKISDFGLSKMGPASESFTHVSTNVKGTFGYLDPEYYSSGKLTVKSDVYAFGVVLLEVLCGRPALDKSLEEDQHRLANWACKCIKRRKVDQIIDSSLKGKILPSCLKAYVGIATKCLHKDRHKRPSMAKIIEDLNLALELQLNSISPSSSGGSFRRWLKDLFPQATKFPSVSDSQLQLQDVFQADKSPSKVSKEAIQLRDAAARVEPAWQKESLHFFEGTVDNFDLEDLLRASAEVLGKGTTGKTYKAILENGTTLAMKRLKDVVVIQKDFRQQMEVLGEIKHENVVPLKAFYYSKDEKLLVYDYVPGGSLSTALHQDRRSHRHTPLVWDKRVRIALSAARGLAHLHVSGKLVHGNIKSSNILLQKDNYKASVSDFGIYALFGNSTPSSYRLAGYSAPEVLETREATFKSDVYSFGVLVLELLTGKAPNHFSLDADSTSLPKWAQSVIHKGWSPELFDVELMKYNYIEEEMLQLMQIAIACVASIAHQRPEMQEVVRMIEEINRGEAKSGLYQSS